MIYMKGVPDLPRCGFSSLAVRVLKEYSIPISARNILENVELKNAVKAYSNWPTFPQIFIKALKKTSVSRGMVSLRKS
nr:monothiol glutaredoxin-S15, mitochondrial-like isoform X2 [Coffea arabica]